VRQQYLDFLSREPEVSEPWSNVLRNCQNQFNSDSGNQSSGCDRITVSAAFFGSPEFQLKGGYVFRFYKVAFGRLPKYDEIVSDMRSVTGTTPEEVFAKKKAFADTWVRRPEFGNRYDLSSPTDFVGALLNPYGLNSITTPDPASPDGSNKVTLSRQDLINALRGVGNNGIPTLNKAQVVRAICDSDQVATAEFNSAFVAMQYYGYLRRTPEAGGYTAWLAYLNAHPSDYRTMVNGFLNSTEYRLRFGQP
jgi:hypothetical protein